MAPEAQCMLCKNAAYDNSDYCVLHFPDTKNVADFQEALTNKLAIEDYNFEDVSFPEKADFRNVKFTKDANFQGACFLKGADFSSAMFTAKANFEAVIFDGDTAFDQTEFGQTACFRQANFQGVLHLRSGCFRGEAQFDHATFHKGADVSGTRFHDTAEWSMTTFREDAQFNRCTFVGYADFSYAVFEANAKFFSATFKDAIQFLAGVLSYKRTVQTFSRDGYVDFQEARIEKPERVKFQTIRLRPSWFIGTDPKSFTFDTIAWHPDGLQEEIAYVRKIQDHRRIPYLFSRLEKVCWDLSKNQEDHSYYAQASTFRYWAADLRRRRRCYGLAFWTLEWWYWAASGYGERAARAFMTLVLIWIGFAFFYTRMPVGASNSEIVFQQKHETASTASERATGLTFRQCTVYSAQAILLQSPQPPPIAVSGRLLVSFEKIVASFQAALLALAIRRRFLR